MTKERLEELKRINESVNKHIRVTWSMENGDNADLKYLVEAGNAFPELITAYERAVGMLNKMQWSDHDELDRCKCPMCFNLHKQGHAPDCEMKKILEG